MPPQSNAQLIAAQIERIEPKVELLYERGDDLVVMIGKTDSTKVSSRAMRIILQITAGGKGGSYNADGGDMGRGSGESYDVATVSPVFKKMSFEQTNLAEWATASDEQSIVNAASRIVANSMDQFRAYEDKVMNATASFSLGTIGSISGTILTMTVPTGAQLVYENQTVQVYDTTQTINRSAASGVVTTVLATDPQTTQAVVVDQLPPGTIAGDVLMSDGLIGSNPVDLFTIKYHQSAATTGVWQNLNRATYPYKLASSRVNGNNGALVPMQPELCINKIRKGIGIKKIKKMIAYMALEQKHAWDQLATTVQIIDRAQHKTGESVDMNPTSYQDYGSGNMHGIPIKLGQNADQTRIDFLELSVWCRATMNEPGFLKGRDGKMWFRIYGASGGIATAEQFHIIHNFQVCNRNPRVGGFVDQLARPSGY
jgi:hypothetical protein